MRRVQIKNQILNEIDRRENELIELCSNLIKIPSENPPGDTSRVADFATEFLRKRDRTVQKYAPKKNLVSIVSELGTAEEPHLVLNGHMDVFPAGGQRWDFDPFSGDVRKGKIFGRGATDMKAGVAAFLFAYALIGELGVMVPGKLVLSLVADEESGGKWGTEWLLNNVPSLSGDACLIAEPGGTDSVVFGEKGRCQFRIRAKGIAGHSPMPFRTANAIVKMARLIPVIDSLKDLEVTIPHELAEVIEGDKIHYDEIIGEGAGRALDHLTVNVGIIQGGRNINTVPDECQVDVDVTLPPGISPEEVKAELDSRLRSTGLTDIQCEFIEEYPFHRPSLYTSTGEKIVRLTFDNVKAVTGREPKYFIKQWGTDGKFFRKKNIPTVVYGTSEMTAEPNECVAIEELRNVTKVHAATIIDFLFEDA